MKTAKSKYQEKVINKLRKLRMDNNISQAQLSDILSISPGLVGNIESYKYSHKYTLKQIKMICDYFNCSVDNIFFDDDEQINDKNEAINLLILKIIEYDK